MEGVSASPGETEDMLDGVSSLARALAFAAVKGAIASRTDGTDDFA